MAWGVDGQCLLIGFLSSLYVLVKAIEFSQIQVLLDQLGIEADGSAKRIDRLGEVLLPSICTTQYNVGLDIVGIAMKHQSSLVLCLVKFVGKQIKLSQLELGICQRRIERNALLQRVEGFCRCGRSPCLR
jgi:hypothetical protein